MARSHKQSRKQAPIARFFRRIGAITFLCLAFFTLGVAVIQSASVGFAQQTGGGACVTTTVHSGHAAVVWAKVHTTRAPDVLGAIKCTPMFQNAKNTPDLIGEALSKGTLANPVLVKPYRQDSGLPQVWVVPVVDHNQLPLALLTFIYDPAHQVLRESEFAAVTGNMFYTAHQFPAITSASALSMVVSTHHVQTLAGRAPELVYFSGDIEGFKAGRNHWSSGGTVVIDPMWRVAGIDGHWHYVDHDGKVHLSNDIPVDPSMPAMPSSVSIS
ncbi:MAG: hypothetical protein H0U76_09340 [Ktedonobacteraceae bacterium]|nr:hypothetical protein [Ktedonobacteraceae bacterium]